MPLAVIASPRSTITQISLAKPNDCYVIHPTVADGDSAIHAIFGTWHPDAGKVGKNGNKQGEVRLENVAEKRIEIAEHIKNYFSKLDLNLVMKSKTVTQHELSLEDADAVKTLNDLTFFDAIIAAIAAVFLDEQLANHIQGIILEIKNSYATDSASITDPLCYLQTQEQTVLQAVVMQYADMIIATAGQALNPTDIAVIDQVIAEPPIVIEPVIADETLMLQETQPHIRICWNNNHFQRLASLEWSSNTIKLIRYDAYPTPNNGDCAFHAIFGEWDPLAGEVRLTDVTAKRNELAEKIRNCFNQTDSKLFSVVLDAIAAIFLDEKMDIRLEGKFFKIREQYLSHLQENKDTTAIAYLYHLIKFHPAVIEQAIIEYADKIIATAEQWLNIPDIQVIAHASQKNVVIKHLTVNESIFLNATQISPANIKLAADENSIHFNRIESLEWTGKIMASEPPSRIIQQQFPTAISDSERGLFADVRKLLLRQEFFTPDKLSLHADFRQGIINGVPLVGQPGAGKSSVCSTLLRHPSINIKDENTGENRTHVYCLEDSTPIRADLPHISMTADAGTQYPTPYLESGTPAGKLTFIDCPGLNDQSVHCALAYKVTQAFATQTLISASHYMSAEGIPTQGLKGAIVVLPFDHWKPSLSRGREIFEIAQWVNDVFGPSSIRSGNIQFVISKEMAFSEKLKSVQRDFKNNLDGLIIFYKKALYGIGTEEKPREEEEWKKIKEQDGTEYQRLLDEYEQTLYARMEKEQHTTSRSSFDPPSTDDTKEISQNNWTKEYKRQKQNLDLLIFLSEQFNLLTTKPDESCLHFFPLRTFEDDFKQHSINDTYINSLKQTNEFHAVKAEQQKFCQTLHARLAQSTGIPLQMVDIFHSENNTERREVINSSAYFLTTTLSNFSNVISLHTESGQKKSLAEDLQKLEERYLIEFFAPWLNMQPQLSGVNTEQQLTSLHQKMTQEIQFLENCQQHYQNIFDMLSNDFRFYSAETPFPCVQDGSLSGIVIIEQLSKTSSQVHTGSFVLDYAPSAEDQLAVVEAECNGQNYASQLRGNIQARISRFRSNGHWESQFDLNDNNNSGVCFSDKDPWRVYIVFEKPRRAFPEDKIFFKQLKNIINRGILEQQRINQQLAEKPTAFDKEYSELLMARINALQVFIEDYFNVKRISCRVAISSKIRNNSSIKSNAEFGPYPLSFLRNISVTKGATETDREDFPIENMIIEVEGCAKFHPPKWAANGLSINYKRSSRTQPLGIKISIKRSELPQMRLQAQVTFAECGKFAQLIARYGSIKTMLIYWTGRLQNYLYALKNYPEILLNGGTCQSPGYIRRALDKGLIFGTYDQSRVQQTLRENIQTVYEQLMPAVKELLLTQPSFVKFIYDRNILPDEQLEKLQTKEPGAVENILSDACFCIALCVALIDFKLPGGYAHPAVFHTFARHENFELHLWCLGDDGKKLAPHGKNNSYDYSVYIPVAALQRFDLLFADGYSQLTFSQAISKTTEQVYPAEEIHPHEILAELRAHLDSTDESIKRKMLAIKTLEDRVTPTDFSISEQVPIAKLLITFFPALRHTDLSLLIAPIYLEKLIAVCQDLETQEMIRRIHDYFHISVKPPLPLALPTSSLHEEEINIREIPEKDITIKHQNILGQGGIGTVKLAIYRKREVAVKFTQTAYLELADAQFNEELIHEMRVMARFKCHPNMLQIIGIVRTKIPSAASKTLMIDSPGIVMEYMEKGSLDNVLNLQKNPDPIPCKIILQYAADIAAALLFLHASKCIHRDLKPQNVMINAQHRAKLGDLGSATAQKMAQTKTDRVRGTVAWMAPEILDYQSPVPYKSSADIYSFGLLLWSMLLRSGDPYHLSVSMQNISKESLIRSIISGLNRPELPEEQPHPAVIADLSPVAYKSLAKLIKMCWAKKPWMRPNAAEILDTIESIKQAELVPCEQFVI